MMIDKADHTTHEHLLSIINTELPRFSDRQAIRLLDVGCGDGTLISYLMNNLPKLNASIDWQLYGFDVHDHGVQIDGFLGKTVDTLSTRFPSVSWKDRIVSTTAGSSWPYADNYFDIILSNQVVEHVNDHDRYFSETHRTLKETGYSVHLFPLSHYLYEGHLWLPFVHRIYNYDILVNYIKLASRLGLGKYRSHHKLTGISLSDFAEKHADYMVYFANHISYDEVLRFTKKHGLRASFRYTREFYVRKLRSLFSLRREYKYSTKRLMFKEWLEVLFLRYVSGITLFLEKKETYRNYESSLAREADKVK